MGNHLRLDANRAEWEKIQTEIEQNEDIDAGSFSLLLNNYLNKVRQIRSAYNVFCKKIFEA